MVGGGCITERIIDLARQRRWAWAAGSRQQREGGEEGRGGSGKHNGKPTRDDFI